MHQIVFRSILQGLLISLATVAFSLGRILINHGLAWMIADLFSGLTVGAFLGEWIFAGLIMFFVNGGVRRKA